MALVGPLGPPVGYGPAKFGARFNRQLSFIPHVCVRSLHVPSPLRFFKAHLKKFACFFVTKEIGDKEPYYSTKIWIFSFILAGLAALHKAKHNVMKVVQS